MPSRHISDGLAELARANERKRDAALLRATTELFVLDTEHDHDEIRRYEQLALHLLPRVSPEDRAVAAARLAICSDAPHAVITLLARDLIEVASPIIRQSQVLTPIDLLSVIAATGAEHQRVIAKRPALAPEVRRALRLARDLQVLATLGEEAASIHPDHESKQDQMSANRTPDGRGRGEAHRLDPWRFVGLDRTGRIALIADIASRPPAYEHARAASHSEIAFRSILSAARIVGFASSGQLPAIVSAIAEGLDLPPDLVSTAVRDPGGELLAVMLKALRLNDTQARQVLLLANPIGLDVGAFFPLSDLYAGMETRVALTLTDAWREATAGSAVRHQAHFADTADRRRAPDAKTIRADLSRQESRRG